MTFRVPRPAIGIAVVLALGFTSAFSLANPPATRAADFPVYDSRYHSYAEMVTEINAVAAAHPTIVAISSIGKSYQGRDLWMAKVSDNVAVDENEPEVMFDSLHHAREHLSLEQNLALLHWLTDGYGPGKDPRITNIVDTHEIWIIFAVNPDGAEYDLTGSPYRSWRKNRQPNAGTTAIGTDINRNYGYRWACCHGSSAVKSAITYHGSGPFSTPEARAVRDFMASRRVGGRQQIRTAITFHTAGQQILWPYGYTMTDVPADMTVDDHAALAALGRRMAATNGYTAMQSSSLYVTDGDEIDWAYGVHHIFMYTMELYPRGGVGNARYYPPDEVIAAQTNRNKAAILMLIEAAGCPYAVIGKARQDCGPLYDDFETNTGWARNPLGTDTATGGVWQQANPAPTSRQAGVVPSGSRALVTGYAPGANADGNDVDGGVTTVRSTPIALPAAVGPLTFRYYFAHSSNATSADYFRVYVEDAAGARTLVGQERGSPKTDLARWATATIAMTRWAGQTVRIVFAAADLGHASTIEAAVDDVRITRP
ncbi:MAG: carboxypeptidase [Chloroflexota bacterium]|nr:carboxypeptidase [Chloroflexota bacterium]